MDIEEYKKLAKNKIEADALTKKVRDIIQSTKWEKQDAREGFKESFQPLVSQFEKPDDPKASNIYTQNQKMIENQLQAIKDEKKINVRNESAKSLQRLVDMGEVTATPKKVIKEKLEEIDPFNVMWEPDEYDPDKYDSDEEKPNQKTLEKKRKIL